MSKETWAEIKPRGRHKVPLGQKIRTEKSKPRQAGSALGPL
jgi:hypothetical protein